MQPRPLYVASFLGLAAAIALACSDTTGADPLLTFNIGQERDTFDDVANYQIDRLDTSGSAKRVYRNAKLPKSFDLGASGTYRYVGTGYSADGKRLAVGRTLYADSASILGSEVPMFFARTDRATRPKGNFEGKTGEYPVVGVVSQSNLWFLDDSSNDYLETDAYNLAYWEHLTPPDEYLSIPCADVPCNLSNLVVVGGIFAIAIAEKWALYINTANGYATEYKAPSELSGWSEVAGGRSLPAANNTSILVGPTRPGNPTNKIIGFDASGSYSVVRAKQARAGAALLFEDQYGLVLAGGSSDGPGVEVLPNKKTEFEERPYPADPIVGATLIMESEGHVLRVGGLTPDGQPAETVRIDVTCTKDCAYEPVSDRNLALRNAQSYYDESTSQTLVVGENESGLTQVFRYTESGFVEIAFAKSQKRVHAAALELPNQQLAIVGGTDPDDATQYRKSISIVAF